jgi:hypothetical protein
LPFMSQNGNVFRSRKIYCCPRTAKANAKQNTDGA